MPGLFNSPGPPPHTVNNCGYGILYEQKENAVITLKIQNSKINIK